MPLAKLDVANPVVRDRKIALPHDFLRVARYQFPANSQRSLKRLYRSIQAPLVNLDIANPVVRDGKIALPAGFLQAAGCQFPGDTQSSLKRPQRRIQMP